MTVIDTTQLVGPTSDIARGIIGMVVVYCGFQIIKDLIWTQPSTSPVSLKGYQEPTAHDKARETKFNITKPLNNLKEETICSVTFDDNNNELCSEPSLEPWLETLSSLLSTSEHGENELFGEEDKDGQEQMSNETDQREQYQQQEPTEELFLSLMELQEAQETKEFQESEKDQSQMALELVCREEDRRHPKDLHRATQQCSFDMRSPERPLPRLVSSVSFDSFLPYRIPVEIPNHEFSRRIAPLPERGRKELVPVRGRMPPVKRPHIPQHEQEDEGAISRPFSLERRSQSLVTINRRKSDVDLFTISLFVLPSMIRRPLMLFSRSLQTTFSIHGQRNPGETDLDTEYDIIKQGEWNVTETAPKQLQRSLTSVSLSRSRPDTHMRHKRGSSESLGPLTSRRRSFFSLESGVCYVDLACGNHWI